MTQTSEQTKMCKCTQKTKQTQTEKEEKREICFKNLNAVKLKKKL